MDEEVPKRDLKDKAGTAFASQIRFCQLYRPYLPLQKG
jgi:hypothetical protein